MHIRQGALPTAHPRDPAYARFASFGGFEAADLALPKPTGRRKAPPDDRLRRFGFAKARARSAKAESGDPGQQIQNPSFLDSRFRGNERNVL